MDPDDDVREGGALDGSVGGRISGEDLTTVVCCCTDPDDDVLEGGALDGSVGGSAKGEDFPAKCVDAEFPVDASRVGVARRADDSVGGSFRSEVRGLLIVEDAAGGLLGLEERGVDVDVDGNCAIDVDVDVDVDGSCTMDVDGDVDGSLRGDDLGRVVVETRLGASGACDMESAAARSRSAWVGGGGGGESCLCVLVDTCLEAFGMSSFLSSVIRSAAECGATGAECGATGAECGATEAEFGAMENCPCVDGEEARLEASDVCGMDAALERPAGVADGGREFCFCICVLVGCSVVMCRGTETVDVEVKWEDMLAAGEEDIECCFFDACVNEEEVLRYMFVELRLSLCGGDMRSARERAFRRRDMVSRMTASTLSTDMSLRCGCACQYMHVCFCVWYDCVHVVD